VHDGFMRAVVFAASLAPAVLRAVAMALLALCRSRLRFQAALRLRTSVFHPGPALGRKTTKSPSP